MEERPWGRYIVLYEGDRHKVKRIEVDPKKRLSYQSHERRAERWIVVHGTAVVKLDDEVYTYHVGDVIFVNRGQKHRLGNDGGSTLAIIEVQLGDYLGEDDIIRYEDDFGRAGP